MKWLKDNWFLIIFALSAVSWAFTTSISLARADEAKTINISALQAKDLELEGRIDDIGTTSKESLADEVEDLQGDIDSLEDAQRANTEVLIRLEAYLDARG